MKLPSANLKPHARHIVRDLAKRYPDAKCSLDYATPLQLLVATILSAQCTDARVNRVTPALFAKYPNAQAFANADLQELQKAIQSTGFFRNKAKSIQACCQAIVERHGGEVPNTLDELVVLAGVGRKTANVVLGNVFNVPGMVVDTHVQRLSRRLGLTTRTEPEKIEQDLMQVIPRDKWIDFSHQIIHHGRGLCIARKPKCAECPLEDLCHAADKTWSTVENHKSAKL